MKIVISGGTGFIGTALRRQLLDAGHQVVLLTRQPDAYQRDALPSLQICAWDGRSLGNWQNGLKGADAVMNLAGESIAQKRWSPEQKRKIAQSRLESTRALVQAMAELARKPAVLINASAVGYYGHVAQGKVTEEAPAGQDFLAETCRQWEGAALRASDLGIRVVLARLGIVLEKGGGALAKMLPPFRLFLGGPLGSGQQGFPWIHRRDVIGIFSFALERPDVSGPVNVTAPEPVSMAEFSRTLARVLGRPCWPPVPGGVIKVLLGEMADMLLTGQYAVPQKVTQAGYRFRFPRLEEALRAILST